jgi:hypothetical protein
MITYQEMVDMLVSMNEKERCEIIRRYWQVVFSDGFVAFVQGQVEAGKQQVSYKGFDKVFGADSLMVAALRDSANSYLTQLLSVWNSMNFMYTKLQAESARQGNVSGMVSHGSHTTMPRGVSVPQASHCSRCGSPVASQGLCSGCRATQQDWEQDDLEYERLREDREYVQQQEEQIYYEQQQDFNTFTDYYND